MRTSTISAVGLASVALLLSGQGVRADEVDVTAAAIQSTADANADALITNRPVAGGLGCTLVGRANGHPFTRTSVQDVPGLDEAIGSATCVRTDTQVTRPFTVELVIQFEESVNGVVWDNFGDPATCTQNAVGATVIYCPHLLETGPGPGSVHRAHFLFTTSEGNQLDLYMGPWVSGCLACRSLEEVGGN